MSNKDCKECGVRLVNYHVFKEHYNLLHRVWRLQPDEVKAWRAVIGKANSKGEQDDE